MLQLKQITKDYIAGDTKVGALKGVDMLFRNNEFVSVLGPSGCGKTTLLNIVGGLDQYTSGDLIINGISTKEYKDRDWDNYRNHSIGFVFQSYNLIPHQSVFSNVELALTISGISKQERKLRVKNALEKVGLADQINKRPNQLSGGQMQRVAIARALVNNPDVILADEPTGALDTETSVQIMELLKEVAAEKLVIMVTHNPELAAKYSTRIIRLLDGVLTDDTNPYTEDVQAEYLAKLRAKKEAAATEKSRIAEVNKGKKIKKEKVKKPTMSFITAFSLSIKNLLTKKARTFLTAFAGSIGIIGIALIMSLSNGFQLYIDRIEKETLSSYPIEITSTTVSIGEVMQSMMSHSADKAYPEDELVYSNDVMLKMIQALSKGSYQNDLKSFKAWLEANPDKTGELLDAIQYTYKTNFNIYKSDYTGEKNTKLYPFELPSSLLSMMEDTDEMSYYFNAMMSELVIWQEMIDNREVISQQYDVITGNWPKDYVEAEDNNTFEVVLVVDKYNQISDYLLCAIGLKDITSVLANIGTENPVSSSYIFDDLLQKEYKVVLGSEIYGKNTSGVWEDKSNSLTYMKGVLDNAVTLRISGIVRAKAGGQASLLTGAIAYTSDLTKYIVNKTNESAIVNQQKEQPTLNVFTGAEFAEDTDYADNMATLGVADLSDPNSIFLYASGFKEKEMLADLIKEYNAQAEEGKAIKYTDIMGILMNSVSTIINTVSYVLIAFVSISLVVSSLMIGIITYISVLERTKEIGVLRSIGASKRDVSRVFNAETVSIGFLAGLLGIVVTMLLNIPINLIIRALVDIGGLAKLPLGGGIGLVVISVLLTLIAGFIPAKMAAKKDPVVALRTE